MIYLLLFSEHHHHCLIDVPEYNYEPVYLRVELKTAVGEQTKSNLLPSRERQIQATF